MRQRTIFDATRFDFATAANGKAAVLTLDLAESTGHTVLFELRSGKPFTVEAITDDGEFLYIYSGNLWEFEGRFEGVKSLQVTYMGTLAYAYVAGTRHFELADPVPHTAILPEEPRNDIDSLVNAAVARILGNMEADGRLPSGTVALVKPSDWDDDDEFGTDEFDDFGAGSLMDDDPGPDTQPPPSPPEAPPVTPPSTPNETPPAAA